MSDIPGGGLVDGLSPLRGRARWIGAANVPTKAGSRINASTPFGELSMKQGLLTLRCRSFLGAIFGAMQIGTRAEDSLEIGPIRAPLGVKGVGVIDENGFDYYFFSRRRDAILRFIAAEGFQLRDKELPADKARRGTP